MDIWNTERHNTTENKLREIIVKLCRTWHNYRKLNRKEVVLNRLRIDHARFSHGKSNGTDRTYAQHLILSTPPSI